MQDLKFALRQLLKNPGFTAVAVLTLALGIGATTAIVSVVRTAVFSPLPVPHPQRLLQARSVHQQQGWSVPNLTAFALDQVRRETNLFARIAAYEQEALTFDGGEFDEHPLGLRVTPEFFRLFGVPPALGRVPAEDEARPGNDMVIVLSHALWQRRFGGDPAVIGQTLRFKERPFTVIGVMPPHFSFPQSEWQYWRPFQEPTVAPFSVSMEAYLPNTGVLLELQPGRSLAQAQALLEVILARQVEVAPRANEFRFEAQPLEAAFGKLELQRTLWALLGAVMLVLLIAAANVASLQLSRTESRKQELALRAALGAGRVRMFRQLLMEGLLLATLGGLAGLAVTGLGLRVLAHLIPSDLPRLRPIALDLGTLGIAVLVTVATVMVFGLVPAWKGQRTNLNEVLKLGAAKVTRDPHAGWFNRGLIVGQIALAMILLSGAGLMVRSVMNLLAMDVGFDTQHLMRVYPSLNTGNYAGSPPDIEKAMIRMEADMEEMQRRLVALPGVTAVGLGLVGKEASVTATPGDPPQNLREYYVGVGSADLLRCLRVPLLQGRWFGLEDRTDEPSRVVLNETAARRLFGEEDPVGRRIEISTIRGPRTVEIVGIVGDFRMDTFDEEPSPMLIHPLHRAIVPGRGRYLAMRTQASPLTLQSAVTSALKPVGIQSSAPMFVDVAQAFYAATAGRRTIMLYLLVFAGTGLFLAAIGLYGVLSYNVARRTREIGVRLALGAQVGDVMRLVLGGGARLVLLGTLLGLSGVWAAGRLLKSFLFGIGSSDPMTLAGVALVLALAALVACWLPARRAARVDPMVALRCE